MNWDIWIPVIVGLVTTVLTGTVVGTTIRRKGAKGLRKFAGMAKESSEAFMASQLLLLKAAEALEDPAINAGEVVTQLKNTWGEWQDVGRSAVDVYNFFHTL